MPRKDPITAADADKLENDFASQKREVRLGKRGKQSFLAGSLPQPAAPDKGKESAFDFGKPPAFDAGAGGGPTRAPSKRSVHRPSPVEDLGGDDDDDDLSGLDDDAPEPDEETEEARLLRLTILAAKIMDYYTHFPHTRPGGAKQKNHHQWTCADDPDKMEAEYRRIRFLMDSKASKETVQSIFVRGLAFLEQVTGEPEVGGWGFNPMNLNLSGLGQGAQANLPEFDKELTEIAIECRQYLSAACWQRLAIKTFSFVFEWHKLNSDPTYRERMMRMQQMAAEAAKSAKNDDL